jgi:hypothetical protein
MFDKNALLRDGTVALSTTPETGATQLVGADLAPQTYAVLVPAAPTGTTPTLDCTIQESDNGSTWRDFLKFEQINAKGIYYVTGMSNAPYRRCYCVLGGTTPNFGNTIIGPVPAGRDQNL